VPSWATSANWKASADPSSTIGFRLYLGWQNSAQLASFLQAVTDPRSGSYREYLTPQQFRAQYAPSQANVNAVKDWLTSQGFTVDYVPMNNHYVAAEGTIAQASAAFGVSFGLYSVQGLTLYAPTTNISVPASLGGVVDGAIGLDDSAQLVHNDLATDGPPPGAFVVGSPCSSTWDSTAATGFPVPSGYQGSQLYYNPCGWSSNQVRSAYGVSGDGAGETVAIIDAYASPTIYQDVNTWAGLHGVAPLTQSQFTQVVAPGTFRHPEKGQKQDPSGWSVEETLDIESVHGQAPAANIVYVGAPNNFQDLDAAMNHLVDRHLASIVSNSYGWPTELLPRGFVLPYEEILQQGVAEGIGIYFSSGDNSDEYYVEGYATPDYPAVSPNVTAVGGTSLGIDGTGKNVFETGWGTRRAKWIDGTFYTPTSACPTVGSWCNPPSTWLYGSGGGVSCIFARPSWQTGITATAPAHSACQGNPGRAVPDISAFGDPNTGFVMGMTETFPDGSVKYGEFREGGTSLSSPTFAGMMATAHVDGFANPLFYSSTVRNALHDVLPVTGGYLGLVRADYNNSVSGPEHYTLRTFDQDGLTLHTTAGWDDVTGLGSPTSAFFQALG
jgi:subtilase family serine protease